MTLAVFCLFYNKFNHVLVAISTSLGGGGVRAGRLEYMEIIVFLIISPAAVIRLEESLRANGVTEQSQHVVIHILHSPSQVCSQWCNRTASSRGHSHSTST
jgi:hypothetical protein